MNIVVRLISQQCSLSDKMKREMFRHIPSIAEVCDRFKKNQLDGFRLFFIGYSDHKLKVYILSSDTKNIFTDVLSTKAVEFSTLILSDCKDSQIQDLSWRCGTIVENGLKKCFSVIYPDGNFTACSDKKNDYGEHRNRTLILGCGNCPTELGHEYMMKHQHCGCDTIDCSVKMNPTFVLDITTSKIPCPDASYDVIIAEGLSFELRENLFEMMVELRRCISPSGYIDFKFRRSGTYRNDRGEWVHPDGKNCRIDFDTAYLILSNKA